MKKIVWLPLSAVLVALSCSASFAEEMKGGEGKKGMMGGMMGGMMMKMCEKSMVATSDGGVVVMAGDKIVKYDKDLNVVKEAEVKVDMEAMGKKMKEMMKMCPMMKGGEAPEGEKASAEASETDHSAHH